MFPIQATKRLITGDSVLPLSIDDNQWQEPNTINRDEDNDNEKVHDQ